MPVQTQVLTGQIFPVQEKTYLHLPFTMPDQAVRLEVSYEYSEQISSNPTVTGGNTIDLGVFDERGTDFLTAGFRGWSGSERASFFITATEATPGYLPGPLNPGQWAVLLGLYKLAPHGCQYQVTVNITSGEMPDASPVAPDVPGGLTADLDAETAQPEVAEHPAQASPGKWLRGELHCHSHHSDGALSPAELIERARERGLDFLAVSDHNTTSALREIAMLPSPGLVLIRGVEVTTFKGHFNAWGTADWIDFRVQSPDDMRAALDYASRCGALTSCGHPKPFGPDWDFSEVDNFACVEVWNGPWTGLNEMSLEFWLNMLAAGHRKPAVGGSDFHRAGIESGKSTRDIGTPTNWVYVSGEPSPEAILDAIRRGQVMLSGEPDGPFIDLRAGADYRALPGDSISPADVVPLRVTCLRSEGLVLRLLDANGPRHEQPVSQAEITLDLTVSLSPSGRYLRAELRDADDRVRALTNPIYLD